MITDAASHHLEEARRQLRGHKLRVWAASEPCAELLTRNAEPNGSGEGRNA